MICRVPDCDRHYGCRLRAKSLMLAASATPTRSRSATPSATPANNWERGVITDARGLPICGPDGPLGVKEVANDRSGIEKRLQEVRDPSYWKAKSHV